MTTREEFYEFKHSPLYQRFYKETLEAVEINSAELINRERPDDHRDTYLRGAIQGMVACLEWEPEDMEPIKVDISLEEQ
jgi:hypothetical protein